MCNFSRCRGHIVGRLVVFLIQYGEISALRKAHGVAAYIFFNIKMGLRYQIQRICIRVSSFAFWNAIRHTTQKRSIEGIHATLILLRLLFCRWFAINLTVTGESRIVDIKFKLGRATARVSVGEFSTISTALLGVRASIQRVSPNQLRLGAPS